MNRYTENSSEGLLSKFLEDTQTGMGKFASAMATPTNKTASLDDILSRLDKAISKTAGAMEEEAALIEDQGNVNPMEDDAQVAVASMIDDSAEKVVQAANVVSQVANTATQAATEAEGVAEEVADTVAAVKEEAAAASGGGEVPAEPTPEEIDEALDVVASAIVDAFTKKGSADLSKLLAPAVAGEAAEGAATGVMEELVGLEEEEDMGELENLTQDELMPLLASFAEQYILEKHASGEIRLNDKTANILGSGLNALKGLGGSLSGAAGQGLGAMKGLGGSIGRGLGAHPVAAGLGLGLGLGGLGAALTGSFGDTAVKDLAASLDSAGVIPEGVDPVQWVSENLEEATSIYDALAQETQNPSFEEVLASRAYAYNKTAGVLSSGLGALKGLGGSISGAAGQGLGALKGLGSSIGGTLSAHPFMTSLGGGALAGFGAGKGFQAMTSGGATGPVDPNVAQLADLLSNAGVIPMGTDPVKWVQENPEEAIQAANQLAEALEQEEAPESALEALASNYFGGFNKKASKKDSTLKDLTILAALGAATLEKAAGVNTGMNRYQENELLKAAVAAYDQAFKK